MKIKREKEALQMFCSHDDFRRMLWSPFVNDAMDGRVMATDAHIAVIADSSLLSGEYERHCEVGLPKVDLSQSNTDATVAFADVEDAYDRLTFTGRDYNDGIAKLGLDGVAFGAERLWRVVTALRLMGFESMRWRWRSEGGANVFEVCDGMWVLVMPDTNFQEVTLRKEATA